MTTQKQVQNTPRRTRSILIIKEKDYAWANQWFIRMMVYTKASLVHLLYFQPVTD